MSKPIAIIGIAGRFPEADTLAQLHKNLREGRDMVRSISSKRLKSTNVPLDREYMPSGYIEEIDKFDHKFFNIPFTEAQFMDPNQKLVMEVAYETFESAGYNIDEFDGSRTAFFLGNSEYEYHQMLMDKIKEEATLYTGNTHFSLAGRIARFFNLRGNAAVVNTGCSSALNVVHMAINELILGDADYAMACGVKIKLFPFEKNMDVFDIGITSDTGKTKSFAADSQGSGSSEIIGCVLLKPLDKALEDNDHIWAVIRSSVANQSALLASSLTATNSVAQSQAIREAWKKADIDPLTVTHIEAHGSGTKLGDPIEIAGIDMAYEGLTDKKHFVAVSSAKSNMGHSDTGAGMSGLIKAVMEIKHKELFPNLHFEKPNPFINFKNSVTYINAELQKWEPECGIRRAGVNSFGFAGNNVHVLLEEAPERKQVYPEKGYSYLVTLSGKTADALERNMNALDNFLSATEEKINDISYTLNSGRKHYEHRFAALVQSKEELQTLLKKKTPDHFLPNDVTFKKVTFVFSPDQEIEKDLVNALCSKYKVFNETYQHCLNLVKTENENVQRFAFQFSLYKLFVTLGFESKDVVGLGIGKLVVAAISGKMTLEEALKKASEYQAETFPDIDTRLKALLERETASENVLFVEVGSLGLIGKTLTQLRKGEFKDLFSVVSLKSSVQEPILDFVKQVYLHRIPVDWNKILEKPYGVKIPLPSYQFEKIRCWVREEDEAPVVPSFYSATQSEAENINVGTMAQVTDFSPEENWSPTEKKVGTIWAEIMKLKVIGLTDDFFAIGGHSLFAIQVVNRIEKEFSFKLQVKDIFVFSTIKSLAYAIDRRRKESSEAAILTEIKQAPFSEHYPLAYAQKRLWLIDKLEGGGNLAYNLPGALLLEGLVDTQKIEATLGQIVNRQESLRTSFHEIDGLPQQRIHDKVLFSLMYESCEEKELSEKIQSLIQPFDLSLAPLFRATLIKVSNEKYVLFYDMHHIIADGFSSGVMVDEFVKLYKGETPGPLSVQYKDFTIWQQEALKTNTIAEAEKYWINTFKGELPVLQMPNDFQRPGVQSFEGANYDFSIAPELLGKLKKVSRETGTTLYMVLLSAYNVLLSKYSGQEDIIVGSPVAGRQNAQLEPLIGMFVNTLALRNYPSSEKTFSEFLAEVKENLLNALNYEDYPFEKLLENLSFKRDVSRNPLFDTVFVYHGTDMMEAALSNIQFHHYPLKNTTSKFDLTLQAVEARDGFRLGIEYCTALFKEETIERLAGHFIHLLEKITLNISTPIAALNLLPVAEQKQLLSSFDRLNVDYPVDETLVSLFKKQVKSAPDARALSFNGQHLSYRELDLRSNHVAEILLQQGVKVEDKIALVFDRCPEMIIAIIGVLKAGACYVPIDPEYPAERIHFMISDAQAAVVLTHSNAEFTSTSLCPVISLDNLKESEKQADIALKPEHLAYIIYTSGSTGQPKGVMIEHRNVVRLFFNDEKHFDFSTKDVWTLFHSYCFDFSVWEIFGALLHGSSLVIVPKTVATDPSVFVELLKKEKVSVLSQTPGSFYNVSAAAEDTDAPNLSDLRYVIFGGEALKPALLASWKNQYPEAKLINMYGITETTVHVTFKEIGKKEINDNISYIGKPIPTLSMYVMDKHQHLVPVGVPGELCVSGAGLARGYLNREDLTKEKFISNPYVLGEKMYRSGDLARYLPDGDIEYLGRIDDQVKIRGFRIELGEIESVLLKHIEIKDVVVIDRKDNSGNNYLCAYYLAENLIEVSVLREHLKHFLPDHMIPSYFVKLDHLPLTSNGKVDRKNLVAPETAHTAGLKELPRDEKETLMQHIWCEILQLEPSQVGVTDNYFELGGDSIKAIKLISRVNKEFAFEAQVVDLFRNPAIREFILHISSSQNIGAKEEIEAVREQLELLKLNILEEN